MPSPSLWQQQPTVDSAVIPPISCPAQAAPPVRLRRIGRTDHGRSPTPTPYISGTDDTRAAGLGEAHVDVVLKVLKLATDVAYTDFLKRKLQG